MAYINISTFISLYNIFFIKDIIIKQRVEICQQSSFALAFLMSSSAAAKRQHHDSKNTSPMYVRQTSPMCVGDYIPPCGTEAPSIFFFYYCLMLQTVAGIRSISYTRPYNYYELML